MKRFIFVALKIVEITAFVFVPYFVGDLFFCLIKDPQNFLMDWLMGVLWTILIGAILFVWYKAIAILGPDFIELNKEWAEKIYNRFKGGGGSIP